jgi:hypothetical protein
MIKASSFWAACAIALASTQAESQGIHQTAKVSSPQQVKNAEAKDDGLPICKEQARGLRGPERSRFLTKCLRDNPNK